MVKSELIELIANKCNITAKQSEDAVNTFFDSMIEALTKEGRVEIRGFGAFTVRKYKAYSGRNPKTGTQIHVEEKKLPFWKTGLELKQRVDS
jgi:integration host factor subunit beta